MSTSLTGTTRTLFSNETVIRKSELASLQARAERAEARANLAEERLNEIGSLQARADAAEAEVKRLREALGNLVDVVNVEFPGGMRDIGGKTGLAMIQAVNVLAEKMDVNSVVEAQKHSHEKPLQLD